MNVWFSQSVVQDLGWTLVHFLWEGLAIAALLAVMLRWLRKSTAHARYLSGCAAMLLMAIAPLVTFRLVTVRDEPPAQAGVGNAAATQPPVEIAPRPLTTKPAIVVTATPVAREAASPWRVERIFRWLVAGWLAGVVGLSVRLLAGWWQVRRLKGVAAQTLGGHWQEKMAELARRLGVERPLRLLESALVEVPTVIGWLRPAILLPASCLTGLSASQLEAILAHELAHIRRHDYLVNLLQSAVETLLFYHPAVWWVSRRVREERENCCDDLAVGVCGDRVGYARALATLEELRPAPAQLALAATGAPLLQRVRRLLGQTERNAGRPAWPVAGIIAILLAAVLAAGMRNQPAQAAEQNTATHRPAAAPADFQEQVVSDKQPGMYNWSVDGLDQLMQQWFWYRVGATNSAGASNSTTAPALATLTGILTDPQFRPATAALEQRESAQGQASPEVATSKGRQAIISKLDSIRVEKVNYPEIPLREVLGSLKELARARDPNGQGINFFTDREEGKLDLGEVKVKVELDNVRLADVLDAIVRTADRPIKYTYLDYGVVFSEKTNEPVALEIRTFHVDAKTFIQGLQNALGMPFGSMAGTNGGGISNPSSNVLVVTSSTNTRVALSAIIRQFFTSTGVDLGANSGKMVIYNDRKGTLTVRATAQDLDLIEEALASLPLSGAGTATPDSRTNMSAAASTRLKPEPDSPASRANALEIARQVQKGRFYLEAGLLDDAEAVLKQALTSDPANIGAQHYLELVKERRTAYTPDPRELAARKALVQVEMDWEAKEAASQSGANVSSSSNPQPGSAAQVALPARTVSQTSSAPSPNSVYMIPEPRKPKPNTYVRGDQITPSDKIVNRARLAAKLMQIKVESIKYPGTPLREVLKDISTISRDRDPQGLGVNLFLDPLDTSGSPMDPKTFSNFGDVKIFLELSDVRLFDVLDGVIRTAEKPIEYTFQDYAVFFSLRTNEPVPLETRTFHVDTNAFEQALQKVASSGPGNGAGEVSGRLRQFFAATGVELGTNSGKSIIWNDRKGTLTVRATTQDLDLIEAAIQTLLQPLPQLNLKVKFLEVPMGTNGAADAKALLDTLMKAGMVMQSSGPFSNGVPAALTIAESLKTGIFTGLLKESEYRDVLKALEQRNGVEILTAPEITTENGRQAQIQAVRINATLQAPLPVTTIGGGRVAGPDAVQSGQAPASAVFAPTASAPGVNAPIVSAPVFIMPTTQTLPFGPTVDVIPYVSADEFSVQMTLIPSVTEFIGYDDPGQFVPPAALPTGQTLTSVLPLPHFRVRQVATNAVVWDGQTVVIGGLITDGVSKVKDQVPMIGDLPVVGRFFRSESFQKTKKSLLIFITPTIINPDGTRVHTEEEMPFSKAATPKGKN
jgi:type II secretory pathway component GspD/PulD (secretin)/beta-lactamase regulating signal transducer with metallopeptidase domain